MSYPRLEIHLDAIRENARRAAGLHVALRGEGVRMTLL